jgi:hypothetical protein
MLAERATSEKLHIVENTVRGSRIKAGSPSELVVRVAIIGLTHLMKVRGYMRIVVG